MDKIIAIGVLVTLLIIGFIRISVGINSIMEKVKSANEFVYILGQYLNSYGKDVQSFHWLMLRSVKFQDEMGIYGLASYKNKFSTDENGSFQAIIRMIPEIRKKFDYSGATSQIEIRDYVTYLQECILRYQGVLADNLNDMQKQRKNPFILLREGVSCIWLFPLYFFYIFGLIDKTTINKISNHLIGKIVSTVIALLQILATFMNIVLGWSEFLKILKPFLP